MKKKNLQKEAVKCHICEKPVKQGEQGGMFLFDDELKLCHFRCYMELPTEDEL